MSIGWATTIALVRLSSVITGANNGTISNRCIRRYCRVSRVASMSSDLLLLVGLVLAVLGGLLA